ncbi:sigma-70 family RNA polymerase sigma factor [Gracilibacillus salitolerans]|uniref:Sigma-70 family RNA polymerase sigma factor n=1 Tax=Gracilibacillus salitolerans TaxID=2663022 RepID=A0A5Q2TS39_9BACI|nr:sigma-70 family RNA polymerase sigma factor [Gracilibacillus salitolerans]QGH37041.1 sigma-70 family RNA polymerase sigma factor [Gracilibacillus salitolerans]
MTELEKEQLLEETMINYGDDLIRLAFQYVKDREIAKDMVQNTFIKCYQKIDQFRNDASIKTWLYRITINECKDHLKSWHNRKVQAKNFLENTLTSLLSSTESKVMEEEKHNEIRGCIFSLPKIYREVIFLYYYKSFTMEEIAITTNVNLNTVKARLRRAKQRLKHVIEEENIYG